MPDVEVQAPSAGADVEAVIAPVTTPVEEAIEPQPAEGQLVEGQEALSTEGTVEDQPEEEVSLEEAPATSGDFAKYKELFKANPELRAIVGREAAFSELGPFSEVKGIVERVPTLDDAEKLASAAQNLDQFGKTYRDDPAGFTEQLKELDPYAFQQLTKQLPQILAETDPSAYREQSVFYTNSTLDNLFARFQNSGNQDAITSLQNVAAMLGVQLGAQRQEMRPDNSEAAKLRKQLAERDAADSKAKAESFWDSANNEYVSSATSEIETVIKKSIPTITDGQLKRMANEVWDGVNLRLQQQPQAMAQIERYKQDVTKGKMGVADRKAIVDFSTRRAKQLIPLVWKEVSAEWSKQVLAANKSKIDLKTGIAAKTKDIGAPPAAVPSAAPPARPNQPKRGGVSGILERIRSGTYQPQA